MTSFLTKYRSAAATIIIALLTLAVGAAAITHQSLWMDEGNAIIKAMMPSIPEMWSFAKHMQGSEIQMPLYMVSLWGWEKVAGNSEYALRAMNLPFLVIFVLALRRYRFWPLVCLTSPFVLYYVGELRPYMFQMAGAAVGFSALLRILQHGKDEKNTEGLHALLLSSIFMAATSLTAAVCSAGLFVAILVARPNLLRNKSFWLKIALWSPLALLVAAYHAYTLIEGFRGAVDRGGGLLSMGFGAYEMIGLLGLGPGRDELRGGDIIGLLTGQPWLPIVAIIIGIAWLIGLQRFLQPYTLRIRIALACSVTLPLVVFAGVSVLANFSVLGRHMSPLIPALLLPLAFACEAVIQRPVSRPLATGVVTLTLLCSIVSCFTLRFATRHERDDYRTATNLAMESLAKGHAVLWQADMNAPRFYADRKGGMRMINYIQTLESNKPSGFMFTDIIFINRPDIWYEGADHRPILKKEGFELRKTLVGFEIWENRYSKL